MKPRLLIISPDIISKNMSGSGIRYWELAKQLNAVVEVTLATPGKSSLPSTEFPCISYEDPPEADSTALKTAAQQTDIIMVTGFTLHKFPFLGELDLPIIIDLYNLFLLENIEIYSNRDLAFQVKQHNHEVEVLNKLLQRGDLFLCANERQRDFLLGMLAANKRLNPAHYANDPTFHQLLVLVPFGLSVERPVQTKSVLKGVYKTIEVDDRVILWGGGIWEWFDPLTLIQALAEVVQVEPKTKLFFLGTQHPHQAEGGVPEMRMAQRAYELAKALNLLDRYVFFNDWVPYDQRHNYLLEADIGVSFHRQTLETHYSFRTRLLDYIWAGLPIVANEGDTIAGLVKQAGLGRIVPSGDITATKGALLELLHLQPSARAVHRNNFERVIATLTWEQSCQLLIEYCRNPKRTSDYERNLKIQPASWRQRLDRAQHTLSGEGPLGLAKLGYSYLKWRLTR